MRLNEAVLLAKQVATKSTLNASHHGCVVLFVRGKRRGTVFSVSSNFITRRIDHEKAGNKRCCYSMHSEMIMAHRIPKHLRKDVVLVVVRVNVNGDLMDSKPCVVCHRIIFQRKLTVYFS